MAELSSATAASALDGTELIPVSQGSAFRKATATQLKTLANSLDIPTTISADTTLDSSHYGKIIYVDTTGVVLAFPTAPATTQVIRAYNGSAGNITVNSVTVSTGKDIIFISVGSAWKRFQPATDGSGGGGLHPGYVSGNWYPSIYGGTQATGAATTANRLWFMPYIPSEDVTISELGTRVLTGQASSNIQFAIYAGNQTTHKPTGSALVSTANLSSATSSTNVSEDVANVSLTGGQLYFFAGACSHASVTLSSISNTTIEPFAMIGTTTLTTVVNAVGLWTYDGTFGTWPDMTSLPPAYNSNHYGLTYFRVA